MAESKVERVATHAFVDSEGNKVPIAQAVGISYAHASEPDAPAFIYQPGAPAGDPVGMLALFGARTLATNVASQVKQARARGEETEGFMATIRKRFAEIAPNSWGAERAGGGGPRGINVELLVQAVEKWCKAHKKPFNGARVLARLTEDAKFRRDTRFAKGIKEEYEKLMPARQGVDAEELDFGE